MDQFNYMESREKLVKCFQDETYVYVCYKSVYLIYLSDYMK